MENQENLVEEGTTELSRSNINNVKQTLNTKNTKPSKALPSPTTKKAGLVENVKRETSFASVIIEQKKSNKNKPTTVVKQAKSEITIFKEEEPKKKSNIKKLVEKKHDATHKHKLRQPHKDDQAEEIINDLKKEIENKKEANRLKQTELKKLNAAIKAMQEELEQQKTQTKTQEELKQEVEELKEQVEEMESTNNGLDELIESLNEKGNVYEALREEKQQIIDELLNTLSETKYEISEIKEAAAVVSN